MARIDVPEGDGREIERMWELAPHMGKGAGALGKAVYVESSLSVREREAARMRIAQLNECHV